MVVRRREVQQQVETLTPRERQATAMIVAGKANKLIAVDLKLSERTVEAYRAKVMEKMRASSVAHLVKLHMSLDDES
jgi:two-component system, LuxR family, response regulator FixJ